MDKVGQIRLDHIIVKYNSGIGNFSRYVAKKGLESPRVDTMAIYNAVPFKVSQDYIVKLLGINGFLDLLTRKLA
jgi:protein involved in ribonucleotide reduction